MWFECHIRKTACIFKRYISKVNLISYIALKFKSNDQPTRSDPIKTKIRNMTHFILCFDYYNIFNNDGVKVATRDIQIMLERQRHMLYCNTK